MEGLGNIVLCQRCGAARSACELQWAPPDAVALRLLCSQNTPAAALQVRSSTVP